MQQRQQRRGRKLEGGVYPDGVRGEQRKRKAQTMNMEELREVVIEGESETVEFKKRHPS